MRRAERLLDIAEVAAATGVAPSALRYYERRRLLLPAGRSGLRRTYHGDAIDRVALIVNAQATGFTLREVRDLLQARPQALRALLVAKTREIDRQIAQQVAARQRIAHALTCRHRSLLDCPTFRAALRELLPGRTRRPGASPPLTTSPRST